MAAERLALPWFVECAYTGGQVPVYVTTQRHEGTPSTFGTNVPNDAITVTTGARSVKIVATGVTSPPTHFTVQAGVQKTSSGNRVIDQVPETAISN